MRILQNILLVIGVTALGTVVGFFGLVFLMEAFQPHRGEEPWARGFGQYIGGMICGAPFGAITGLVGGILFMRIGAGGRSWSIVVWLGILLGLVAGGAVGFNWRAVSELHPLGTILFAVSGGTLGGMLASGVTEAVNSLNKAR